MDQIRRDPFDNVAASASQSPSTAAHSTVPRRSCSHRRFDSIVASVSRFTGRSERLPFDARTTRLVSGVNLRNRKVVNFTLNHSNRIGSRTGPNPTPMRRLCNWSNICGRWADEELRVGEYG